ncbi:MAG TPA: hypothetical protein VFB59_04220 [Candidatus Saccharimonadales bacterium]|nr:hypothetical protein [Candidatus Saccharimonadales bacterium]
MSIGKLIVALGLVLGVSGFIPATALAHLGEDHTNPIEARQHEATTNAREDAKARLSETQKDMCEQRATNITTIMGRSVKRAENFGSFLTTMSQRVTNFVKNQTKPVDPALITALEQAQAQFATDLAAMKEKAVFSCNSDSPKEQIVAFQQAHRTILQDLKNWRLALKDIIVLFKPAQVDAS